MQNMAPVELLTVDIPRIKDVQPPLNRFKYFFESKTESKNISYQSEACQDRRIEAARIGSEFALEKFPIASCKPLSAIPRW